MQRLELIGNIGADAKLTNLNDGKAVLNYSVAIYNGKDKAGKDRPATWVNCQHYFKSQEVKIQEYLVRGAKVFVSGRPKVEAYMSNENKAAAALVCVVDSVQLIGGPKNDE
jgi:single-strand DNA-binding protein